jgi:hypothetical protein
MSRIACLIALVLCLGTTTCIQAQPAAAEDSPAVSTNTLSGTPAEQKAALQLEVTNAWNQVILIVNQPVRAYSRTEGLSVSIYSPGWFHPGASTPDFDTVDVRKTQEFPYANHPYVTSDLNPGLVFLGADLEFNSMTKLFYVDRSRPKHKLTEAQMLEINRLYRIIGRCQRELRHLQTEADIAAAASETQTDTVAGDSQPAAAPGPLAAIQRIPRQTRMLYGGIAIGALLILTVVLRMMKGKSD